MLKTQAFQELKEWLVSAPILVYPLPDAPFIVDTDASNHAVGAVLSQIQGGQERVIAFYSQTSSLSQNNTVSLTGAAVCGKNYPTYYGRHFMTMQH